MPRKMLYDCSCTLAFVGASKNEVLNSFISSSSPKMPSSSLDSSSVESPSVTTDSWLSICFFMPLSVLFSRMPHRRLYDCTSEAVLLSVSFSLSMYGSRMSLVASYPLAKHERIFRMSAPFVTVSSSFRSSGVSITAMVFHSSLSALAKSMSVLIYLAM